MSRRWIDKDFGALRVSRIKSTLSLVLSRRMRCAVRYDATVVRRGLVVCLVVGACSAKLGNQGSDGATPPKDSGSGGSDSGASGSDGGMLPDGPLPAWSMPTWVQSAGGSNEYIDNETLSSDQLEMYFCVLEGSGAYKQLWMMSRPTVADAWGTPAALGSDFNTPAVTSESPRLTPDNLTLYWGHNGSIWYAQRATEQTPWTVMGAFAQVNVTGQYQKWMAVCTNNATDYFMVSRSNGSDYDLYEGQIGSGTGTLATELDIGSDQISTFLSADCLTTYYASDGSANGNTEIYMATRATPTSTWSTPTQVTAFDSATTDKDPWISPDQLTFYLASTRFTGTNAGNRAVYMSTR